MIATDLSAVRLSDTFEEWYARYSRVNGLHPNPDHPAHCYNYRAYFRKATDLLPQFCEEDHSVHLTDEFKTTGHPTGELEMPTKTTARRADGDLDDMTREELVVEIIGLRHGLRRLVAWYDTAIDAAPKNKIEDYRRLVGRGKPRREKG